MIPYPDDNSIRSRLDVNISPVSSPKKKKHLKLLKSKIINKDVILISSISILAASSINILWLKTDQQK